MGCFTSKYPADAPKLELIGNYKARLIDVYDGDTQIYIVKFKREFYRINVRVNNVDTPEIRSKNPLALEARNRALQILTGIKVCHRTTRKEITDLLSIKPYYVKLVCYKNEKYGRTLASVYNKNGVCLAKQLISEKLAVLYDGGRHT